LSVSDHEKRVKSAKDVLMMMQTDGWLIFLQMHNQKAEAEKTALYRMDPKEFGATGLHRAGYCAGMVDSINLVYQVIEQGRKSEERLDQIKAKDQKRPGPVAATRIS
jgi:hypothetical protein